MRFPDREMAGRQLAAKLTHLKDAQPVVLALPRGGVAVGFEICPGSRRAAPHCARAQNWGALAARLLGDQAAGSVNTGRVGT